GRTHCAWSTAARSRSPPSTPDTSARRSTTRPPSAASRWTTWSPPSRSAARSGRSSPRPPAARAATAPPRRRARSPWPSRGGQPPGPAGVGEQQADAAALGGIEPRRVATGDHRDLRDGEELQRGDALGRAPGGGSGQRTEDHVLPLPAPSAIYTAVNPVTPA